MKYMLPYKRSYDAKADSFPSRYILYPAALVM